MEIDRPIVTDRLILRRFTEADLDDLAELVSDPQVMRYYPRTLDREGAKRWLDSILSSYERFGYGFFYVQRRNEGDFAGLIGLLHWDDVDAREDVEVAYLLRSACWGHGYATEAARACKEWAFEHLGVDRVVSFIAVENAPSIAVAERNGMKRLKQLDENRWGKPMYVYGEVR